MALHPDLAALFVALSLVSMVFAAALAQALVSLAADVVSHRAKRLSNRA